MKKRRKAAVGVICILVGILLFLLFYVFVRKYDASQQVQDRGSMSEGFGQQRENVIGGKSYKLKWDLETFLLIGTDRRNREQTGYRSGGQADTLILLVADHQEKVIRMLQLDRDTMAQVTVLGVLGNYAGLREMQICLAHAYGATPEENNQHTVEAVSRLLDNIPIDGYLSIDLVDIPAVNRMLGGVTVTLEDDFSQFDPQMVPGATLKLTDQQAELFLHSRMMIGDGTNSSRMRRHRMYLDEVIRMIREKLSQNASYGNELLNQLSEISVSSVKTGKLINELNRVYNYTISPMETLDGEYRVGEDGFKEFHADQTSIDNWVIKSICE